MQTSCLPLKDKESQVNTLISTMGYEADDMLSLFGHSVKDKMKYEILKDNLERHFIKQCNKIYKQAKFNQQVQHRGESVDSFITFCIL